MAETFDSGHTVEKVTGEEAERLAKSYFLYTDGAIRLHPGNWMFPSAFAKFANLSYNFKIKSSDIFMTAIPKSGIHWLQEIVWNLKNNPDLDNPDANIPVDVRCQFYETDFIFATTGVQPFDLDGEFMKKFIQLCPGKDPSEGVFTHMAAAAPDPRLIKNHLGFSLLPPDMFRISKVIYIARDPRDVMLSFYYFSKLHTTAGFRGTLEESIDDYINGRNTYGPYWEHVRLAWEKRNNPNFLFLHYEDLKADPKSEIRKIDKFLGTNRTDKQIDNVVYFTEFSNMKERTKNSPPTSFDNRFFDKEEVEKGATFYRKGKVGTWREEFSPELTERVNAWMKKHLSDFGDDFKYKI